VRVLVSKDDRPHTPLDPALEREKLEALAEFAAGAGHEMNNPLAVIAGRAQLLLRDETDPERRRELAVIHTQALRVVEMIGDLMLFARPPQPKLAPCDLAAVLKRIADEFTPRAADAGCTFTLRCDDAPLTVTADESQLTVAVRALCTNALEAVGKAGHIELGARQSDAGVQITVRDDGPGITPEIRRHLFDPFFSGRSAGRGLGTGLSKCWRIVTNHGGTVEVESAPGAGATFTITL
jgi:signal transduction histidine kinase